MASDNRPRKDNRHRPIRPMEDLRIKRQEISSPRRRRRTILTGKTVELATTVVNVGIGLDTVRSRSVEVKPTTQDRLPGITDPLQIRQIPLEFSLSKMSRRREPPICLSSGMEDNSTLFLTRGVKCQSLGEDYFHGMSRSCHRSQISSLPIARRFHLWDT